MNLLSINLDACLGPSGPSIALTHVLDFSDIGDLYSTVLSPDGSRLYALIHGQAIDFGQVVAQFWPEWTGAATVLIALVLTVLLVRSVRRRQLDGDPYCPRCNYNLSGQGADPHCPECGLDASKRPPVRGLRNWKRARPFATALVLLLGAYGALWACRVPRGVKWLHPGWVSTTALKWCDMPGLEWLKKFQQNTDVVVQVNAATGERQRIICTRLSATLFHLVLTPDGSGFYLNRPDNNGVDLIKVTNGHVAASYKVAPWPLSRGEFCYEAGGDAIIGHTSDGAAVLSYWSDSKEVAYAVVWNPATGKTVTVASTEAYDRNTRGIICEELGQFVLAGQSDPIRVISTPLLKYPLYRAYEVRFFGPDGSETHTVNLTSVVSPFGYPAIVPDGSRAYFSDVNGRSILELDLATGLQTEIPDLDDIQCSTPPVLAPDGVRLFIPGYTALAVRDMQRKEWIATLDPPTGFFTPSAISSPTPSRVAAVFQGPRKSPSQSLLVAAIWDIPPSPPQETKP